jgi:hypothetical protein
MVGLIAKAPSGLITKDTYGDEHDGLALDLHAETLHAASLDYIISYL